ncbi:cyclic nucleotide-binding domain-containing protein [Skermanella sp. TT6]|uniref:Cyclic nucleotide-binding domain-containing protein n=1 Tax=Skermanella cutis TaxID=2775420 RepID=A0ABX7B4P0_9PROT|nr:cyclic nucleotide-binding domain-containing protein [Skermanella sp. TT6]QQP89308.1 cyclic nucleotide-binding domain-containing protein [Skermanella sp. TT6]
MQQKFLSKKVFFAGEVIFKAGDPGSVAYLIEKGRVAIHLDHECSREPLTIKGDSEIFGEMALIDGSPRCASAVAMADTTCIQITDHHMSQIMETVPVFVKALLHILILRLRQSNNTVRDLRRDDAAGSVRTALGDERC